MGIMDYHNDSKPVSSKTENYNIHKSENDQQNKNLPQVLDFPTSVMEQSIKIHKNTSTPETIKQNEDEAAYINPANQKGIVYRVQFLASKVKLSPENILAKYKITEPLSETISSGWYKYAAGSFKTFAEALNYSKKLKNIGLKDSFVVKYKNGARVQLKK